MLNLLEALLDVPALMKNADDLDPVARFAVKDEVRADGKTKIPLPDMIDVAAFPRSRCERFNGADDFPMIGIGLSCRPGPERVEPNHFEIGASDGEKPLIPRLPWHAAPAFP